MSFVAPLWLAAAAAVAIGVLIAHLFSTNVPPREVLPTVRFVPQGAPLAVLRTRRLTDVGLLLLRLLAVLLLGLALAGAHVPRAGPPRVVVVDVSRAVGSTDVARASITTEDAEGAEGGVIVIVDSTARVVGRDGLDTLKATGARGSLSAGIVAAHRAIADATSGREDIELVIVSPVAREEVDSATSRLLALWEGRVRVVRVPAAEPPAATGWEVRATGDDPVRASLGAVPTDRPPGVRIVRDAPSRADSLWARDSARVLVIWPAATTSSPPVPSVVNALQLRATTDTSGAVTAGGTTVVGSFTRARQPRAGRVIARWMDGEPAATERVLGDGCIREVAIPIDPVGDAALRDSFRALARSFLEPCGGARDFTPVPDSALLGTRSREPAGAGITAPADSRLPLLLALAALLALGIEQLLRRVARRGADA